MRRFFRFLRARQSQRDLEAEMQAHVDEKIDELVAEGLSPEEARSRALCEFGNRTRLAERCREKWILVSVDEIARDLRHAWRFLRRNPAFATVAVLSLALGIAANTIIFSAVDHALLCALPYPQPDRLFAVWSRSAQHGTEPMHVSPADFYDWRRQSSTFESLSAYASWPMNLTNVDEPRRLETQLVSASFFSTLGDKPEIGRTFLPDEDQEQSPFVVVISHHLWQALGGERGIAGRQITLNGSQATVVGVMPAAFAFPSRATDAWVPLSLNAANRASRDGRWLAVIARLKMSAGRLGAATEMDVVSGRLAAAYPATNAGWSVSLVPLQEQLVARTRPVLLTLQAGTGLLLLIACVNLANLLLAKGTSRTREIGVRSALGAGRVRIVRQLMVESAVLAALGGALGLALARQGLALVRTFGDGIIPRASEIRLSGPDALFAVGVTLVTVLIFGLAPALHSSNVDLRTSIGSGARGTQRGVELKRGLLVAIEIGLACVLLVGAGLLGESLARLLSIEPGLRTNHVLSVRLTLSHSRYPSNAAQNAFFEQIVERVQNLPGIVAAGVISETPLKGNNPTFEFVVEGLTPASDPPVQAGLRAIGTGYFSMAGIPILKGRNFAAGDREGATPVAIVNETMARRYWRGFNPVGRRVRFKEDRRWMEVAAVVPDVKHLGQTTDEGAVVYVPFAQKTQDWLAWTTLLVRTAGEPLDSVRAIRNAVRGLDKNQPLAEIETLDEIWKSQTAMPRFTTAVVSVISGFAFAIAVVGVYGLLAYTVAQRLPELGIRLTLGASPLQIAWLLLRQTMLRVFGGLAAGLLGAWWAVRWLESLLFGVRPHDPATFAGVAVILIVASFAAVLIPAHRVVRIDPSAALRTE